MNEQNTDLKIPATNEIEKNKKKITFNSPILIFIVIQTLFIVFLGHNHWTKYVKFSQGEKIQDVVKAEMENLELPVGHPASDKKKFVADSILFPLESIIANLTQTDGHQRFVRLTAVLKFTKSSNEKEIKGNVIKIKDIIITFINAKRAEDLFTAEGKKNLKEKIIADVNAILYKSKLMTVYFIDLQIN